MNLPAMEVLRLGIVEGDPTTQVDQVQFVPAAITILVAVVRDILITMAAVGAMTIGIIMITGITMTIETIKVRHPAIRRVVQVAHQRKAVRAIRALHPI